MSGMCWRENRLIQRVGDKQGELGYVGRDGSTGGYVLWLKDHDGVFLNPAGSYVRGDEWPTLHEAKEKAPQSASAMLAHLMWMKSAPHRYGFLAMQFDKDEIENLSSKHIKPVIWRELGYEVQDLRNVAQAGIIDEIMRTTIKNSKFVIADLTHDNNGAYWEAGYAEGIGIPVIYICEKEKFNKEKTHFDTNHLTTVLWSMEETDRFEKELTDTLRRSLNFK